MTENGDERCTALGSVRPIPGFLVQGRCGLLRYHDGPHRAVLVIRSVLGDSKTSEGRIQITW